MQIENLTLDQIKPYENNPRKKWDIEKIADSIAQFGFQQPIVVDKNKVIIIGHGRYAASKILELKTVPVLIADLPPTKAKALRIADNKVNEYSDWDYGLLHKEFTDLLDINYDLENLGFEQQELESIITFDKSEKNWLDTEKEWEGMPEFKHDDLRPHMSITVNFVDKKAVEDFFKMIGQDYTEKTKYIWLPKQEKNVLKDKGYATE